MSRVQCPPPRNDPRQINCESIRAWRRQVLDHNLAPDTRRITCPIAHCGFASEERVVFRGRATNTCDIESDRDGRDVKAKTNESALYHFLGIASRAPFTWMLES